MGREARCRAEFNDQGAEGKALLETDELVFRSSDFKLRIRFADMVSVGAAEGRLEVSFPEGKARSSWARRPPAGLSAS